MTPEDFARKYRTVLTEEMRNDIMRVFGGVAIVARNDALDEAIEEAGIYCNKMGGREAEYYAGQDSAATSIIERLEELKSK
jgi:hypothetical protein